MMGISLGEVLVILFFALLAFGPEQIPKIARTLGRLTREIKRISWDIRRAMNELEREVEKAIPQSELADLAPKQSPEFKIEGGKLFLEKKSEQDLTQEGLQDQNSKEVLKNKSDNDKKEDQ